MNGRSQLGFTYVALLIALAVLGVGLAATGVAWQNAVQRDREADLLFIGQEFREAIALYYLRAPGQVHEYPKSLEDLMEDQRFPGVQRYLRQVYRDPMTGQTEWGLVLTPTGRIMGVHSLSRGTPLKTARFPEADRHLAGSTTYVDWQFVFVPPATMNAPSSGVSLR